ncbi:MAG: Pycsar system effector family protein [Salinarimonas sp.]
MAAFISYDLGIMGNSNHDEAYDKLLTALLGRVLDMLRFAEAKNAALLAFTSAWIAGIVSLLSSGNPIPPGYDYVPLTALPLFILAATVAMASLLPNLRTSTFTGKPKGQLQNLLFFGDIAEMTIDGFRNEIRAAYRQTDDAPTNAYFTDLEAQISINSKVAKRKHRMFNIGAMAALAAIALFSVPTVATVLNTIGCWISR